MSSLPPQRDEERNSCRLCMDTPAYLWYHIRKYQFQWPSYVSSSIQTDAWEYKLTSQGWNGGNTSHECTLPTLNKVWQCVCEDLNYLMSLSFHCFHLHPFSSALSSCPPQLKQGISIQATKKNRCFAVVCFLYEIILT